MTRTNPLYLVGALAIMVALLAEPDPQPKPGADKPTLHFSAGWLARRVDALMVAWQRVYSHPPTRNALALAIAVASVEGSGDIPGHPGLVHWGGVHSRALTSDEALLLKSAGFSPCVQTGTDGEILLRTYGAPGMGARDYPDGHTEVLACDHTDLAKPETAYWVWLTAWHSDADAAAAMLRRMQAAVVLDDPDATPDDLALRMQATYHYGGTVDHYAAALWPAYRGALSGISGS